MGFYRLSVGYQHNVRPGDLVGALVNEADIEKSSIGRIQLFDDFCVVQMPVGMPDNLLSHLKTIRIRGQAIAIEAIDESEVPEQKASLRASRMVLVAVGLVEGSDATETAASARAISAKRAVAIGSHRLQGRGF